MYKLIITILLALAAPLLWAAAARADSYDHHRAWTQSSDTRLLTNQEQQRLRLRQSITDGIGQMNDIYHMMSPQSSQLQTAAGLLQAANTLLDAANSTADYYSLENYHQQMTALRQALQVIRRL